MCLIYFLNIFLFFEELVAACQTAGESGLEVLNSLEKGQLKSQNTKETTVDS